MLAAIAPPPDARWQYQLEGRVDKRSTMWWWSDDATSDRTKLEWVVEAPDGGTVAIEARHQRAGIVRVQVELGGEEG